MDFRSYFDRLTDNAQQSLERAEQLARKFGSSDIGTEHLLLGMLSQEESMGAIILKKVGITYDRAKTALKLTPKKLSNVHVGRVRINETANIALLKSWDVAREYGQDYIGTEHILYSILNQKNTRAVGLLEDMSTNTDSVEDELKEYLKNQHMFQKEKNSKLAKRSKRRKKSGALDFFGDDLTSKASKDKLDPLIGREQEIQRTITILNRRTKNNPVLIGEPGVGKTAIVEGLAQRIASEEVPDSLLDKRIVSIDLAGMIAGTKYRGEFEERLKRLIKEIEEDDDILVFVDELHLIVGAGAAEGAIDAGNMLKPALARGSIHMIGATTIDEYRKHIEKDTALERRFQEVKVSESSDDETIHILRGLKPHYEDFHGVTIQDEVIEETVKLAARYMPESYMPDKAIDLMDEASAKVRIDRGDTSSEIRDLKRELRNLKDLMESAAGESNYEAAHRYKTRMSRIEDRLKKAQSDLAESQRLKLTSDDLAGVVSNITGVPVRKLLKAEAKHLLNLEDHISDHIIGQDDAVKAVSKAIRRNRSGVSDMQRPIGSFIFLGPSGVGKTELARVLAREIFHNEEALIKIDMSEFMQKHSVARLVGAPAGYVGYDEGGQLTDRIRRQPYSMILFDEIEKAHPEVFNMLLQILEDGQLTDAKGREVDFSNTIIIMTSNIGAERLKKEAVLGFRASKPSDVEELRELHEQTTQNVLEELKKRMRPELLNRIDKVVVFRALTKDDVSEILELQLDELSQRVNERRIGLKLTSAAKKHLVNNGYDPAMGVRPLRRVIQDEIEDQLAIGLLKGEYEEGDVVQVGRSKGELTFKTVDE